MLQEVGHNQQLANAKEQEGDNVAVCSIPMLQKVHPGIFRLGKTLTETVEGETEVRMD